MGNETRWVRIGVVRVAVSCAVLALAAGCSSGGSDAVPDGTPAPIRSEVVIAETTVPMTTTIPATTTAEVVSLSGELIPDETAPDGTPATYVPSEIAFSVRNDFQPAGGTWDLAQLEAYYKIVGGHFLEAFREMATAGVVTDKVKAELGAGLAGEALSDSVYDMDTFVPLLRPQLGPPEFEILRIVDQTPSCVVVEVKVSLAPLLTDSEPQVAFEYVDLVNGVRRISLRLTPDKDGRDPKCVD